MNRWMRPRLMERYIVDILEMIFMVVGVSYVTSPEQIQNLRLKNEVRF
jgi:hypothetical protein